MQLRHLRVSTEKSVRIVLALVIWVPAATIAVAQTSPLPPETSDKEAGLTPYQAFDSGGIDNVNLSNGNVVLNFPLVSYPQRGGVLRLNINLIYNGKPVQVRTVNSSGAEEWIGTNSLLGPFITDPDVISVGLDSYQFTQLSKTYTAYIYSIHQADGATHLLGSLSSLPSNFLPPIGTVFESLDATAWQMTLTSSGANLAISRSGVRYPNNGTVQREDTNGNMITGSSAGEVDTMGRVIPNLPQPGSQSTAALSSCPAGPLSIAFAYAWNPPGPSGSSLSYLLCYAYVTFDIPSSFKQVAQGLNGQHLTLQSIVLPNNTTWKFEYSDRDSTDPSSINYGSLTKVTLPTGGTVAYTYALTQFSTCDLGSRWVTSRTVNANDGTGSKTWTYSYNTGSSRTTTVTDPLGNQTVHTFGLVGLGSCSPVDKTDQYYQGTQASGALMKTVATTYSGASDANLSFQPMGVYPIQRTTTWPNGQSVSEKTTLDGGFTWYDPKNLQHTQMPYGLPVTVNDYDYTTGTPPGTTILRQTNISYIWQSGNPNAASYLNRNLIQFPYTVQVKDGSGNQVGLTQYNHDETALASSGLNSSNQFDTAPPDGSLRGNTTSVYRWLSSGTLSCPNGKTGGSNGYIITNATFFDDGMLNTSSDPCGNTTTYAYSLTYQGALPTSVNNALNQTTTFAYDFNTSLLTSTTDPNSQTTTKSYDVMRRPTQVSFPDTGSTKYCYTDMGGAGCSQSGPPYSMVTTKAITSSTNEISTIALDGLGREVQTQLNSDPQGTDYTVTTYDALGRKSQVYNPTRCNPPTTDCGESTFGYTTYHYDALGRVTSITKQDGSVTSTDYSAYPCTTVTDEAGKSRKSCVNGLGQLTQVFEDPGSSPHLNYETDYGYNALSDLLSVTQKGGTTDSTQWRARSFTYDSVSRLLSANNPESGSIAYAYDPIGNVTTRTAPAPNQTGTATVTTTYAYDALNRLTQKSYSDGSTPSVFFAFDGPNNGFGVQATNLVGRLDEEWTGTSCCGTTAEIFGYDQLGRINMNEQFTVNLGYHPVNYTYDLAGDLTSGSNGEGVTISYSYDAAGRPTGITSSLVDSQHPATLLAVDPSVGYYPTGQLRKMKYSNGLTEATSIERRLQPCRINLNSSNSLITDGCNDGAITGSLQDFEYAYGVWGSTNNGNVTTMDGNGSQNFARSYGYDSLNRLTTMTDSASNQNCKGLQETYDAWGNRTNQSVTSGSCFTFSAAVTTQNRLSGYSYDAAGNMTGDGTHTYTYDAENRIIKVDGGSTATYVYDAEGRRAEKLTGSFWHDYIHDLSGNPAASVNPNGWERGYVYLSGKLIAEYGDSTTYSVHSDHLGSTRLMTNVNGTIHDSMDYQPFGEQIAGDTGTTHKFDGKERDGEDGLDNFGARYNSSALGRFMTPDWAAKPTTVPYASFGDPQSLNLYAFVENTPVDRADADGHTTMDAGFVQHPENLGSVYGSAAAGGFDSSLNSDNGFVLIDGQFREVVGGQLPQQTGSFNILGQSVPYTAAAMPQGEAVAAMQVLGATVDAINDSQKKLTETQVADIHAVKAIYVAAHLLDRSAGGESVTTPAVQRQVFHDEYILASIGTYIMNGANLSHASIGYWASSFVHEGTHIMNFDTGTPFAEGRAYYTQYTAMHAFNVTQGEVEFVQAQCGPACR